MCPDLARALIANSVFKHKIATHDLLSFAMKNASDHLKAITTEQLQHGDMMSSESLLPAGTADLIAETFFDFVVKHNLAHTMVRMRSSSPNGLVSLRANHT